MSRLSAIETHHVGGRAIPLRFRESPRARRILLTIDQGAGAAVIVLPRRASRRAGLAFAEQMADWLHRRLDALPPRAAIVDGAEIPVLGKPHRIVHLPGLRGDRIEHGEIRIGGELRHLPRRVRDRLKALARRELGGRAMLKAMAIGREVTGVSVRDTRSRWGSCGRDGRMSFSWRLVLAPEPVLDYVVAHEVAHLVHAHHGPAFWNLAESLTDRADAARAWLRREGASLLRFG
ncbi:MAG: M48 family metallopeptidase [Alphaproteobacteria bacterium]|nr:M48 family metallopeptidase [Alphaproteobacteria bacterium]